MRKAFCAAILPLLLPSLSGAETAPYAGQDQRDIAALSAQDVDDLLAGRGWGFAKSAELNGYPGPAHVLEMAEALSLTTSQRAAVQAVFDGMNAQARALGADFVAAERRLDAAFQAREVDADLLAALVTEAGRLEAELRAVHLQAHLQTLPLMERHQVALYNQARGYGGGGHSHE